ncbi:hypothetical protein SCHPADRAFT_892408 [Schizopora paradoxa]|uniref:gamma-glutamylcyclotransferase n=1 Tax=Schizopora paradoxa TaxID=27342 RepID=A0A0H2S031_9AGAM|nr:hypothetical protein SCHPADRAFT_892408 [Schizopora paradoxa]
MVRAPAIVDTPDVDASFIDTLAESQEDCVWYLAYGSNLSSPVFKGRRGIKPLDVKSVYVKGVELAFDLSGLPYVEPRFANCRLVEEADHVRAGQAPADAKRKDMNGSALVPPGCTNPWVGGMIGVAYLVTPKDFANILKTEGGGSSYEVITVDAQVLDDCEEAREKERFRFTGKVLEAFTLSAPPSKTRIMDGHSSLRYLNLIRNGARVSFAEHRLPVDYIAHLDDLPHYAATFRQKIGRVVFIATFAPVVIPVLALGLLATDKSGNSPQFVNTVRRGLFASLWWCHDNLFAPVFGSGEV